MQAQQVPGNSLVRARTLCDVCTGQHVDRTWRVRDVSARHRVAIAQHNAMHYVSDVERWTSPDDLLSRFSHSRDGPAGCGRCYVRTRQRLTKRYAVLQCHRVSTMGHNERACSFGQKRYQANPLTLDPELSTLTFDPQPTKPEPGNRIWEPESGNLRSESDLPDKEEDHTNAQEPADQHLNLNDHARSSQHVAHTATCSKRVKAKEQWHAFWAKIAGSEPKDRAPWPC
eukprot:3426094-Rhodomonas_salina.4